jgi:hypothetical protein
MDPNGKLGKTAAAPVHVLDPVEFDFSQSQPLPPVLGKTHTPVHVLPELTGEFVPPPAVTVTLWVRPDATPATVGADLFAVWKALDEYDRDRQGAGLRPGEVQSERTADGEVIRLVLAVAGPGAVERLTRLRDAVNGTPTTGSPWAGRSFVKWAAESTAA